MKKVLAAILCAVVLFATLPVYADEHYMVNFFRYKIEDFSDDELTTILELIQAELDKRGVEAWTTVNPGVYMAGRDLSSGVYEIKASSVSFAGATVVIHETMDNYNAYQKEKSEELVKNDVYFTVYTANYPVRVVIDEDDVLDFRAAGIYQMRPAETKLF